MLLVNCLVGDLLDDCVTGDVRVGKVELIKGVGGVGRTLPRPLVQGVVDIMSRFRDDLGGGR